LRTIVPALEPNADGAVDGYFGTKVSASKESNSGETMVANG
jgi:hypothetical protein